ncbi:MAG: SDR family NAD(P)-dependent oxidoreductase [Sporocytophaga sp.]|uniref:SDR family NAD(P)-dependent oxidoreductase n=1 Tax=Sporocytophaga sp. TaxID=2231183 RepID=UPI001B086A6E|nr:SDR family NAD(P)-dependent oxidoreductase [Sporocytophaga sp.]MBO9699918.1 SDR family NAD(P)-dependent oxidoreductase [Sporocytophaga sp.]
MLDKEILLESTESYLKSLISEVANISIGNIVASTPFQELGIDSFRILQIIKKLEEEFGTLPKTLLFENFNISDLSQYFVNKHEQTLSEKFSKGKPATAFALSTKPSLKPAESISEPLVARPTDISSQVTPILILEKDAYAHPELKILIKDLFDRYKNEGSSSRGTRNIAPNIFIGSARRGYFNYSRSKNIILLYTYTGPKEYFPVIAEEMYRYCINHNFELNIFSPDQLEFVGEVAFSSTPFGVLSRVVNIKDFTLQGSKMRRLRYQVSKFEDTGKCRTEEYQSGTNKEIDAAIAGIIDQWCAPRTMVNPLIHIVKEEIVAGNLSSEHRLFITYLDDVLQNVILISKLSAEENGYLMDLEFYPQTMPLGGLEFAIVKIIEVLAAEGCDMLSLGGTYGCKLEPSSNADPYLDKTLDYLREQKIFNDEGNLQFKNKFRPENRTVFICRPKENSNPDNVTDIIMMIADPTKMQTSDEENHTFNKSNPHIALPAEKGETHKISNTSLAAAVISSEAGEKGVMIEGEERSVILSDYGYNPLNIPGNKVEFDLKTDSWAQLEMPAIQNQNQYLYTQLPQPVDLKESIKGVFPFTYFAFTTSGRTAEHAFFKSWSKKGIVPQNLLFPTTIFNQIDNGFKPLELPHPEVFILDSTNLFKGNLNWDALQKQIELDPKSIAFVIIETSDNAAGGAPVSMQHLRDLKSLLAKYSIPLVLDATRTLENARFIIQHEKGFAGKNIWDVVREIHSTADALISSLTKDFCVSKGGLIATNDPVLYNSIQNLIQEEGIGLDVIEKKFIALSLNNLTKIESRIQDRIEAVHLIWNALKKNGIPVVQPAGGHCILIDVDQVAEFRDFKYPVASFVAWMFLNTGIRAGAHNAGMQKNTSINNLVRLAIPVGLKRRQIEEIIKRLISLFERKKNIPEILLDGNSTESIGDINAKYKLQSFHNASGKIVPKTSVSISDHNGNVLDNDEHLTSGPKGKEATITKAKQIQRSQDIAIVGMSGRYPKSKNLDELWANLVQGKDCIETIPDARFNQRMHSEFTKKYRSGFIDDVDRFDSMFFNISPREAEIMDPQERHFLEVAWEAIEDAGYYPETLTQGNESRNIGVFVGAVWNMYQMIGVEEKLAGNNVTPNSFFWSIANRVSYWMNFTGTSLTLDTACSSSLTAVYLACEAINNGNCSAAIVGGVNLDLHQSKWDIDWAGGVGALSKDGVCRTFGKGANGYVPGEGVGALLLKPLDKAIKDGDNIHGVIKSAAVNHGGKTSGYLVPNPHAQTKLIQAALEKGKIDARSIGYIEAHGTGTELGDPVEISGLTNAFKDYNVENESCSIGSIKTNIGHLEAAAGIVGVQKVLLMMKHSQLVPSLHSSQLNEFIDFKNSPFYVEQTVEAWKTKEVDGVSFPLRAGISSFGAGGANAHVIIEKYEPLIHDKDEETSEPSVLIFPFSARNEDQLREMAVRLRNYIQHNLTQVSLQLRLNDIAYTLQIGRKSFDYRLAIIAGTKEELLEKLTLFVEGKKGEGIILGQKQNAEGITKLLNRKEKDEFINLLSQSQDPQKLAQIWVDGLLNDWQSVQGQMSGRRISLPTYPFADKRHWIGKSKITALPALSQSANSQLALSQTPETIIEEEFSKLYYSHDWEISSFDKEKASHNKLDSILIFDFDETLRNLYQDRLDKADSKHVILVQPGDSYQELENFTYRINPRNPQDYTQLFKSVNHKNLSIGKICFAWPMALFYKEGSLNNASEYKENYLIESLEKGVYSFLYLCQSLIEQKPKEKIQLLYVYLGAKDVPQPHNEAINGFTRSLQIENPKLYCKTLEIQQGKNDLNRVLEAILAELHPGTQEMMTVRYVEDDRYVRKLKQVSIEEIESSQSTVLKENGVYIITGGAGGLGFIFAEFLAKRFKAKLVLTGRSKPSSEIEAKFDELRRSGAEVLYVSADVSKGEEVKSLVEAAKSQFGEINGIIHAAGVLRDSFIRNKKHEEMEAVFAPKIFGTLFLDEETKNEKLDFFVMFSSLAAIGGNAGQCDYSFANHFMDTYAIRRKSLEIAGERSGRSLSYNWSLWADGGMKIDEQTEIFFKKNLGIKPLSKEVGIDAFVKGLSMNKSHVAALEGVQEKIELAWGLRKKESSVQLLGGVSEQSSSVAEGPQMNNEEISSLVLKELSQMVMGFLKLDAEDIGLDQILSDLGFDSIGMTAFANTINEKYQLEITPVLFFEYPSINEITRYLCSECRNEVLRVYQVSNTQIVEVNRSIQPALTSTDSQMSETLSKSDSGRDLSKIDHSLNSLSNSNTFSPTRRFVDMPIAIVGMSGVMPQSDDIDEFWQNLLEGQDMVTVIPRDRWNWEEYDGDPFKESHKTYSKWGGFMKEVDKFDPLFFGISPKEAEMMDPQQRIFLETVWKTIEHSGHKVSELSGTRTGLFVGASYRDYLDLFITSDIELDGYSATGNTLSILVNRISFLLNLRGPSISLDTACSSSLIAIHRAVEAIHTGSCDMAIAGGIQTMLTPAAHMSLASAGMLSRDGKCKTFDKRADGYVRGEGSGAILLKPLAMAEADGDHIYAVIKSIAENHGGRVTTLTAPNPNAQAELLVEAYEKAHIDPTTVGYIECHGTGTSLGDPIEIQGLKKAFSELYRKYQKGPVEKPHCGLGTVKSNIGHLEIAAGIAGVLKVVLAIQHKQIPASLHLEEINPYINLKDSPFYIVNKATPWEAIKDEGGVLLPRRAGVSSFGFGGVNGHIVLEEYIPSNHQSLNQNDTSQLIVLSAKNEDRLRAYVKTMLEFVEKQEEEVNLGDFAYTLQVGRDAMPERLALVVSNFESLKDKFRDFLQGTKGVDGIFHDSTNGKKVGTSGIINENSIQTSVEKQDLIKLAELWVSGAEIDWSLLDRKGKSKRVGLPTYPFAREQYWLSIPQGKISKEDHGHNDSTKTAILHSLVHSNVSTLREQKFSTKFTGKEFYFEDYIANAQKFLPWVACLEMAKVAGELAGETPVYFIRNIVWENSLVINKDDKDGREVTVSLIPKHNDVEFVLANIGNEQPIIHCKGKLSYSGSISDSQVLSIAEIQERCPDEILKGKELYSFLSSSGLKLGKSFQMVERVYANQSESLAIIKLGEEQLSQSNLNSIVLDGALQSAIAAFIKKNQKQIPIGVPLSASEVQFLHPLIDVAYGYANWSVDSSENVQSIPKMNLYLLDKDGKVLVRIKNLSTKPLEVRSGTLVEKMFLHNVWKELSIPSINAESSLGHILVFDQSDEHRDAMEQRFKNLIPNGSHINQVKIGSSYRELDNNAYEINPEDPNDYQRLFYSLAKKDVLPENIVYLWAEKDFVSEKGSLKNSLKKGVFSLLFVSQALMQVLKEQSRQQKTKLLNFYPCSQNDLQPHHEAISGFAKCLHVENPNYTYKTIEIRKENLSKELRSVDVLDFILPELKDESSMEIRYQDGKRLVKKVEEFVLDPSKEKSLKDRGVYIITGGLGALGLIFAKYIAEQTKARLVLTGRSALRPEQKEKIRELESLGSEVVYFAADISEYASVERLVKDVKSHYGEINGIIHCAGVLRDSLILNKTSEDMEAVYASKVYGTCHLDEATKDESLDFFALFSSITAVGGNAGQSDYGYANSFMDNFVNYRNQLVKTQKRLGKTITFNWPLWKDGAMQIDEQKEAFLEKSKGIKVMGIETGLDTFERALADDCSQVLVLEGNLQKIRKSVGVQDEDGNDDKGKTKSEATKAVLIEDAVVEDKELLTIVKRDLLQLVMKISGIKKEQFSYDVDMSQYGFDSISLMKFFRELSQQYSIDLSPAVFYEYSTFNALSQYLCETYKHQLSEYYVEDLKKAVPQIIADPNSTPPSMVKKELSASQNRFARKSRLSQMYDSETAIAIVGMSGVMPQSEDLTEFWDNIVAERDLITEIPSDRWDWKSFQVNSPNGKNETSLKWGGFMKEVDKFDPSFFGISAIEAKYMDPQQRIFLETVWKTIEDAGHRPSELAGTKTGVFVGVGSMDYADVVKESELEVIGYTATGVAHSILPNRISYLLDLHGPSEPVDTACSSSLVAIQRAVDAIANGSCEMAIVGGVNALINPSLYVSLGSTGVLSNSGRCKTFDKMADGYVRGEGAGAIFLKKLDDAIRDGNHVYGVIKSIGVNHGGHAASLTAPNPNAQADLIASVYDKAQIDPKTISYVEVHGTGTLLGDSVEVNGLKKAFAELYKRSNETLPQEAYCGIGTIKTNIGHLETAAGIAGVFKVLLGMKYKKIPGNIHFNEMNPHIRLEGSPFYIVPKTQDWKHLKDEYGNDIPFRAGISSFGFGGVNAHIVLEEYVPSEGFVESEVDIDPNRKFIIPLSAKNKKQLKQIASDLLGFIEREKETINLKDLAYTLQVGREAMEDRLGFVVSSIDQLAEKLQDYIGDKQNIEDAYQGHAKDNKVALALFDEEMSVLIDHWLANNKLAKLLEIWVKGQNLDWVKLYEDEKPKRISLPTYPFARERYWINPAKTSRSKFLDSSFTFPKANSNQIDKGIIETIDSNEFEVSRSNPGLIDIRPKGVVEIVELFLKQEIGHQLKLPAERIATDQTFIELGLGSLALISLIEKTSHLLQESLSPSVFFEYSDIPKFSKFLIGAYPEKINNIVVAQVIEPAYTEEKQTETTSSSFNTEEDNFADVDSNTAVLSEVKISKEKRKSIPEILVPMQTKGNNVPIFAAPGSDGNVLSLLQLSKALGDKQPFYGFQSVGLDGKRPPLKSIEEIANINISVLQNVQPKGPYNLLGYSNGGVVAYEMTRILLAKGEKVESLMLLDTPCPLQISSELIDPFECLVNVCANLTNSLGRTLDIDVEELRQVSESARGEYVYHLLKRNGVDLVKEQFLTTFDNTFIMFMASENCCRAYKPSKLSQDIDVLLFRATKGYVDKGMPDDYGWNVLLQNPINICEVKSNHFTIIDKGAVEKISKEIHNRKK